MRTAPPNVLKLLAAAVFAVVSILTGVAMSSWQNSNEERRAHCRLACEVQAVACCGGTPFCGEEGMDLQRSEACYVQKDACEDECT
jgi:hypothetical protein